MWRLCKRVCTCAWVSVRGCRWQSLCIRCRCVCPAGQDAKLVKFFWPISLMLTHSLSLTHRVNWPTFSPLPLRTHPFGTKPQLELCSSAYTVTKLNQGLTGPNACFLTSQTTARLLFYNVKYNFKKVSKWYIIHIAFKCPAVTSSSEIPLLFAVICTFSQFHCWASSESAN